MLKRDPLPPKSVRPKQFTGSIFRALLAVEIALSVTVEIYVHRPTVFDLPEVLVSIQRGGTPGVVNFTVQDGSGRPVQGIPVASESDSGFTPDACTDANGQAEIQHGEREVNGVRFDGTIFNFEDRCFFRPHCNAGLQVRIQLHPR